MKNNLEDQANNSDCKDKKSGRNYNVLKLEADNNCFARFELEVPSNGEYKLYVPQRMKTDRNKS